MGKGEIMTRVLFTLLFIAALTITAFSQTQNQPEEEFSGINSVSLSLFDNQILAIQIIYAPHPYFDNPWDNAAQLIPVLSETFNLPHVSYWDKNGAQAKLRRAGFEMTLTAGKEPMASLISNYDYRQIIRQRREADKQKGRSAFKP